MCGISGGFSLKKLNTTALREANDCLAHRGPDASGYYVNDSGSLFLGHRRLSIIDLSEVANQPMFSASGRHVMVYNGEVYNFRELRQKMKDHAWQSHSDTEVILELFEAYGPECFQWLNGMFALAIYDKLSETLFIARDQVGIKPLFLLRNEGEIVFSSELKVISRYRKSEGRPLKANKEAVPYFLHLGFIPEPLTIFQGVEKFPAGSYGVVDMSSGSLETRSFWEPSTHFLTRKITDPAEAERQYREILFRSVEEQMVSDVPLGTFLSGGIDSSLVTAVAQHCSSQKIKTFSIGFREAQYDESAHASAVADHLGTEHHSVRLSVKDMLDLIPSLMETYDEPFADSSAFPTMLVSSIARKEVTVALSGDGGDELFQGYGMYTWANRLSKPFTRSFRKPAFALTQMMGDRFKRGGALFSYPTYDRIHTHIFSQEQYFFSEQELESILIDPAFDFTALNETTPGISRGNAAENQAFWDLTHYLRDDLLVKVDRASMKYSLETRVPLLDLRIVEFALNLDYKLKVSPEYGTKHLMKKLLYELVPRAIFERPKRGFAIPLKEWLKGPLKYLIDDYLNDKVLQEVNIVDTSAVRKLLARFHRGEDYLYNRIWVLAVLHQWFKTNGLA